MSFLKRGVYFLFFSSFYCLYFHPPPLRVGLVGLAMENDPVLGDTYTFASNLVS